MEIAELKKIIDRYDTARRYGGKHAVLNVRVEKTIIKPRTSIQSMQVVIVYWQTGTKKYNEIVISKTKMIYVYCQPFSRQSSIEAENIFEQALKLAKKYPSVDETKIIKSGLVKLSVGNSSKGWGKDLSARKANFKK